MQVQIIVGARPQFIKTAALIRAMGQDGRLEPVLVHTGQHYDSNMSQVFFDELSIPAPARSLGVGSGTHGAMTGRMLERIESLLLTRPPAAVVVLGDTNSTLAGALAGAKLHSPVLHVEAGLRSFDKRMPEEVNRVLTDHVASLLFCPTQVAVDNLRRESLTEGVVLSGDVMYDSVLHYRDRAMDGPPPMPNLAPGAYLLATVHRAENTDDPSRLAAILSGLGDMARTVPVVLVLHPRTRQAMAAQGLDAPSGVRVAEPLPYLAMLRLLAESLGVVTDSGGMQKEAFFLGRPCLTVRDETEWIETVVLKANALAGADPEIMRAWLDEVLAGGLRPSEADRPFGDGRAAERIVRTVAEHFSRGA